MRKKKFVIEGRFMITGVLEGDQPKILAMQVNPIESEPLEMNPLFTIGLPNPSNTLKASEILLNLGLIK